MGQYHTLDLETQRNVTIIKDEWDSVALDRVKEACDVARKAEIGAVVLHEGIPLLEGKGNSRIGECVFADRTYDYPSTAD